MCECYTGESSTPPAGVTLAPGTGVAECSSTSLECPAGWSNLEKKKKTNIFTEQAPRPLQSISCNVCLSVCSPPLTLAGGEKMPTT